MDERKKLWERMDELIKPVDSQIMMTDDRNELLLLATAMLQRVVLIYDNEYGREARNALLKDIMTK
jgi:hypothetical protein